MEFYDKYIKYKTKYLNIKTGGSKNKNKNKIIKNNNMNRFHVSEPWFSLILLGIKTKIIDKRVYKTFKEYLEKEGI